MIASTLFERGTFMGQVKHRYWVGVLYVENMLKDWQDDIDMLVQLPFAYCVHNQDIDATGDFRKSHVHIIIAWPSPTTYNNAFAVFDKLSAPGLKALNKIEPIVNMEKMYHYLIHDTDECRKKKKHLYRKDERITGNNFDIDCYITISTHDKLAMTRRIADITVKQDFRNFKQLYLYITENIKDDLAFMILQERSGFFERLITGNHYDAKQCEPNFAGRARPGWHMEVVKDCEDAEQVE